MATARKITDFMSSGTHANRPATPPGLGTGEIAIYYETDTGHMFAYVSGVWTQIDSVASSPAAIVQHGLTCGTAIGSITLGAAPTKGNRLVALFSHFSNNITPNVPNAGLGWTNLAQTNGTITDGFAVFYKIVGAGESATQQISSATFAGAMAVWEISGGGGILLEAPVGQHDVTSSPNISQSITTTGSNEIVLALFVNASTTVGTTGVTNMTQDDTTTGGSRAATSGHATAATPGTYTPGVTYAANKNMATVAVAVG